jgi:hypothetical protein
VNELVEAVRLELLQLHGLAEQVEGHLAADLPVQVLARALLTLGELNGRLDDLAADLAAADPGPEPLVLPASTGPRPA